MEVKLTQVIELREVTKFFGENPALSKLSLSIFSGERIAILGANGAGKSTLLRIVSGLLTKDTGEILIDGVEQTNHNKLIKKMISYLPDEPPLYDLLNPIEYLEYIAAIWEIPIESVEQQIYELMEAYDMTHASRLWINNFSKGMRQKLGLISVLFRQSPILLLDEPFSALDTDAVATTVRYLQDRSLVQTALIVSHDLDLLEQVSDRAIVLHKGKIIDEFSSCENLIMRYEEVQRRFRVEHASEED